MTDVDRHDDGGDALREPVAQAVVRADDDRGSPSASLRSQPSAPGSTTRTSDAGERARSASSMPLSRSRSR